MSKVITKTQFTLYKFLIVIAFIGDILRRMAFYYDQSFTRYTTVSKIIFIVVSFFCIILIFRKQFINDKLKVRVILLIFSLIIIYLLGHFDFSDYLSVSVISSNFEYLAKYLFLPYLMVLFLDLRTDESAIKKLIKFFEIFFYINLAAMLIGYAFNINEFLTYADGNRFGYKGIYSMSGQTSIYFILMIFYYLHNLLFKEYTHINLLKLSIICVCAFMIGTKRIYFFIPILLFYYFFFLKGYKKKITYQFGIPIGLGFSFLFFLIKKDLYHTFNLMVKIKDDRGILSSFTSYRSDLFLSIYTETIESKWNLINFLFGGLDFTILRTEMGFIDLFLFFGLIGFIIYLFFYKILFQFKFSHSFYWFFASSLILIVFLADAFILEANTPILFLLLCFYFYNHEQKKAINV